MQLVVQIAVVVGCAAVLAIAVVMVRAIYCVERATTQATRLSTDLQLWIREANTFTREAREAVASAHGLIPPIRRVVDRFETLGERTADLSAAALDEVELPLRTAVSVARGLRRGSAYLLGRWLHRMRHGRSTTHERSDHE